MWQPWNVTEYTIPPDPRDNGLESYTAIAGITIPHCACLRCEQNYFDVRFLVGRHRGLAFHMGKN